MVYGGNTTCLQIEVEHHDELLIVDCGTGFRNLGNHLTNGSAEVKGRVFITHPHWDHLQGFPFFKPFYEGSSWIRVYLPPQEEVGCKDILQGHMSNTFFPVTIDMLEADMECETFEPGVMSFNGFNVDYMWARHTVKTAIYRFVIDGKTIIFAPDNELPLDKGDENERFIKEFQEFVRGADVLIHDAQFSLTQHREREGWGHSCWEKVVDVTKDLGIKRLFLTHHDPDSDDAYLEKLNSHVQQQFSSLYEELCFAKEGQVITLP